VKRRRMSRSSVHSSSERVFMVRAWPRDAKSPAGALDCRQAPVDRRQFLIHRRGSMAAGHDLAGKHLKEVLHAFRNGMEFLLNVCAEFRKFGAIRPELVAKFAQQAEGVVFWFGHRQTSGSTAGILSPNSACIKR
jgi:hypothetical protein